MFDDVTQESEVVISVTEVTATEAPQSTIAETNPLALINDVEVALRLAKRLKATLAKMHPSVTEIIRALF